MYESLIGKRHVLCVLSVFLLCAFFTGKEVFANERTIEISIAERNNENCIIIDGNELGGSIPLLPGCEVRTGISIRNTTNDDLYIRWECLADRSDTALYRYLQLRLYDEKGNMAYEGTVGDLSFISGPRPSRSTGTWTAVLFVPPEADNAIAGDELEFDLVLSFSDNPAFKDGEDPVFVPDIKETGGMGHRYYASVQMTGPADFASGKAQKDENGYPLITSGFCRDGIGAPRSGYAFDRDYTGGGSWNVYAAPMEILLHGIDSGEWVLVDREKHHWKYRMPDGSYLKGGFALVRNPYSIRAGTYRWYCFEESGIMAAGWIRTDGDVWYHAHEIPDGELGALEIGWITDSEDGALYYTSEQTAAMLSGWIGFRQDDGSYKYSYFARPEDTYRRNWFYSTAVGRWIYDRLGHRSYGSMYRDEMTPDHCRVDRDGIRTEKEDEVPERKKQEQKANDR